MALGRFKTTASGDAWRSLKEYVGALKPNQTAIYYLAGDDLERLKSSPQLEGFRARGVEVLLLPDPVDSFWVMPGVSFDGKPFKSVTQGATDLASIARADAKEEAQPEAAPAVKIFVAFLKSTLGDAVSDVRVSDRSLPRYMRLRRLWKGILDGISIVLAQSEEDAKRLKAIGAPPGRVWFTGNLKYDVRSAEPAAIVSTAADRAIFITNPPSMGPDGTRSLTVEDWP